MKDKIEITLLLIGVWLCIFINDYACVKRQEKPIFMINTKTYKDGGTKEYYGLGYKVIDYNTLDYNTNVVIGTWWLKYEDKRNDNKITIIDKTEACDMALELIYEDDNYNYFLPCIKSDNITVNIGSKTYSLDDILTKKLLTIDQLEENGLEIVKMDK